MKLNHLYCRIPTPFRSLDLILSQRDSTFFFKNGVFDCALPGISGVGFPRLFQRLQRRQNPSGHRKILRLQSVAVVARSHDAVRSQRKSLRKKVIRLSQVNGQWSVLYISDEQTWTFTYNNNNNKNNCNTNNNINITLQRPPTKPAALASTK